MYQPSAEDDIYSQNTHTHGFHHGNEFVKPLTASEHRDLILQRLACLLGGFGGAYVLINAGQFASAQTLNMIELVLGFCALDFPNVLLILGAFLIYAASILISALLSGHGKNLRKIALIVSALCMLLYSAMPEGMPLQLMLYPSFLMMPMLWIAFSVPIRGYNSACIFSTNNLRQTIYSLGSYLCDRDRRHLEKAYFFAGSLFCFHLGVILAFVADLFWGQKAALLSLLLIIYTYILVQKPIPSDKSSE
ncbi:MAG: DUF1275 domain-containing protein [Lachnospiraceae bacterium]|nr:DUF1275 domain-containing protein [Lachnospiraceae bacterium]